MNNNDIIVSLDIGTSKIRVIIGEFNQGALNVIGIGTADSKGIKKGAIVDIDQTVYSINEAVKSAERMVDISIDEVYVGIAGNHIDLQLSQGVVAVSSEDREISDDDIDRVIQASKVVAVPPDKEIIDVVPKEFIVDGLGDIKDPRGMIGVRLEVVSKIITGSKTIIHNLKRTIEKSGLSIAGFVYLPLATSQIALSSDEMNLGAVLVDIGKGTSTISIFEQEDLVDSVVIPVGGEYITNDISIGLRAQMEIAEQVKLKYGVANIDDAAGDMKFKIPVIGANLDKEFSQLELSYIIEPRVREIFQIINNEVKKLGYKSEIPGGYVLTGGVVALNGILDTAREELLPSVRVAIPNYIGVKDPSFTNGVGIVMYASKNAYLRSKKIRHKSTSFSKSKNNQMNVLDKVKDWFKEFI